MPHARSLAPLVATVALLVAGATACDPPPPTPTFHVVLSAAGPDAAPGDGVCATAGGACSLAAAIDETNAVGKARIEVDRSLAREDTVATLTGVAEIVGDPNEGYATDGRLDITVAAGATLTTHGMALAGVTVHGTATIRSGVIDGGGSDLDDGLHVGPTGVATVQDVFFFVTDVRNEGVAVLRAVTMFGDVGPDDEPRPVITTTGAGRTVVAASYLRTYGDAPVCAGTSPESSGYNATLDASCGFGQPTDIVASDLPHELWPEEGSPLLDAIPAGALGCGSTWTTDITGYPRPRDGDLDGTNGCDIGAYEAGEIE